MKLFIPFTIPKEDNLDECKINKKYKKSKLDFL